MTRCGGGTGTVTGAWSVNTSCIQCWAELCIIPSLVRIAGGIGSWESVALVGTGTGKWAGLSTVFSRGQFGTLTSNSWGCGSGASNNLVGELGSAELGNISLVQIEVVSGAAAGAAVGAEVGAAGIDCGLNCADLSSASSAWH